MLIGLIADTHDHVPHIKKAVEVFKDREVELVLHAGDYCSPFTIPHFEGLNLKGILGNNDGDKYLLMDKFESIGAELEGEFMEVETGNLHIAVYHGTYQPITKALHKSGIYDVVITGHTHTIANQMIGTTLAINPGSAHGFEGDATIALLDTETKRVEFVDLN
ncbi:metallophosphoesterase [Aliifodinibius sp. S!AR15-10]|uniref:metallophosphoesterase n=1 Tax=Aliifodinibius sp. S!AR15-10 TaxID=2950437 RepID=UPI0028703F10|nr:metallophosphoesterase [Aliifodinibius sp. S!AR15-10]